MLPHIGLRSELGVSTGTRPAHTGGTSRRAQVTMASRSRATIISPPFTCQEPALGPRPRSGESRLNRGRVVPGVVVEAPVGAVLGVLLRFIALRLGLRLGFGLGFGWLGLRAL